jgi:hypothetical protein
MAEHKDLQDPFVHEMKGASTAIEGQVPFADGLGATPFRNIVTADISDINFSIKDRLTSRGFADQELTAAGDTVQIAYGAADTSPGGCFSIDALGTITFLVTCTARLSLFGNIGRTGNSGNSILMFRFALNDAASVSTLSLSVDAVTATASSPLSADLFITAQAGDEIKLYMGLDADPSGAAGLYPYTPVVLPGIDWPDTPSTSVTIDALGV